MADPFPPAIPLPPSAIPFPLASSSRHVNTGFGFGSSSPALSAAGPSSGGLGFDFGTPYKRPAPSTPLSQFGHTPSSASNRKKRQLSPGDDEDMVDAEASPSGGRRRELKALGKGKKRVRGEAGVDADGIKETKKEDEGLDIGVLLASLPASSHLALIMSLISSQPAIKPLLLSLIPQLDLNQCLENLDSKLRAVEAMVPITSSFSSARTGFGFGSQPAAAPGAQERNELYVWNRVKSGVAEYCSVATTYLNFFLPSSAPLSRSPSEPNTIHHLLHTLTVHLYRLLPLVPSSTSLVDSTKMTLQQHSHALTAAWRRWTSELSVEVNQRGGMYPASRVAAWGDSLDQLASQRREFAEIRDLWLRDVGWLIGRRPAQAW